MACGVTACGVIKVATACGDDDPTAVGIGDVVEAKKLSRTPTNQRASDFVEHGLDLDVSRRESRGNVEESIADFLGLEVSGGPRNECGQRHGCWLTNGHGARPIWWRLQCMIPHAHKGDRIGAPVSVFQLSTKPIRCPPTRKDGRELTRNR